MQNAIFTTLIISFLGISCHKKTTQDNTCLNYKYGTVADMKGLDGCGFNIRLDNGTILEPTNIDDYPRIKVDNQRIQFTYQEVDNMASICMVGPMVKITCAEAITEQ